MELAIEMDLCGHARVFFPDLSVSFQFLSASKYELLLSAFGFASVS